MDIALIFLLWILVSFWNIENLGELGNSALKINVP